ncbi:MAG: hypothetical protein AB7V48_15840 [Sedimentibacter sp.]
MIKTIGYSSKINDPAFDKYLVNTSRWSAIFSVIIAVIAVIGFFIYGETSREMDNPQALLIGIAIGSMFILIALYQIISRNKDTTWDGVVTEKKTEKKQRNQNSSNDDYYVHYYHEYKVVIIDEHGKSHTLLFEDDDAVYNYYNVGDRVRHHKGLNSYEKYDKSKDTIIFCNACGSLNNIEDDYCFRCNCPLLK